MIELGFSGKGSNVEVQMSVRERHVILHVLLMTVVDNQVEESLRGKERKSGQIGIASRLFPCFSVSILERSLYHSSPVFSCLMLWSFLNTLLIIVDFSSNLCLKVYRPVSFSNRAVELESEEILGGAGVSKVYCLRL
jgi:hypothetical protein